MYFRKVNSVITMHNTCSLSISKEVHFLATLTISLACRRMSLLCKANRFHGLLVLFMKFIPSILWYLFLIRIMEICQLVSKNNSSCFIQFVFDCVCVRMHHCVHVCDGMCMCVSV